MRHNSAHTYRLYKNCKGKSIVLMRVGRTAVHRANLAKPKQSFNGENLLGLFSPCFKAFLKLRKAFALYS